MNEKEFDKGVNKLQEWFNEVGCPETYLSDGEYTEMAWISVSRGFVQGECDEEMPKRIKRLFDKLVEYSKKKHENYLAGLTDEERKSRKEAQDSLDEKNKRNF
ncbi:MAG: hypothetical protein M0P71_01090 [Melioribacteraceae bacterium]|nr:hypothetical protein [Melioribacteraceae bacterium]